jgi:SagB-type dehydrogenase family enzyme
MMIKLPGPSYDAKFDLNKAMQERRSVREYRDESLALDQVAQLLWSAQGVTSLGGFRTAPSGGALYPLELYLVVGKVDGLAVGLYKYNPLQHTLTLTAEGDRRAELAAASLGQSWMSTAPALVAIAAVYERTTSRYGERGSRYIHMEVGHAAQNIALEAVAMGLGAVDVAAFSDLEVKKVLGLPAGEQPLCIVPVGRK